MRQRSGLIAMTTVMLLLGFLVVVQLRAQAAGEGLNSLSVQDLGELVGNLTTRSNQLRDEIRVLERQRETLASAVERGGTSASQVRTDLRRTLGWSGALGVSGAGVRVRIDGPLPGDAVGQLVNQLRNAGAEAVSIGTIRVVPGVVVTGPAGNLVVNGLPLEDPLELLAIGQPETLSGSLARAGGPIAQLAARFPDALITVTSEDVLSLPPTDRDLDPRLGAPRL